MNRLPITTLALALSFAFSGGVLAAGITKTEFKAGKDKISAEYKLAKTACASLAGNHHDICVAEAKGKEKVALAELDASYKPSSKADYQVSVAKAEAVYAVASEKCDDLAGNAKDVCVKEAKAAQTTGKADAKATLKTTAAKAVAVEKTSEARSDAKAKVVDAKKDAAASKQEAQFKVAKEKCDALAGDAKDVCVKEAKTRFGQ